MAKILTLPITKEDFSKFLYYMREIYFKDMSSSSINIMLDNADYIQFKKEMTDKFNTFFLINKLEFIKFIDELKEKGIIDNNDLLNAINNGKKQ
jgi:hypothetical protein